MLLDSQIQIYKECFKSDPGMLLNDGERPNPVEYTEKENNEY